MSWSFEKVAVVAKETVQRITSSPAQFMEYLTTAGNNYKYPFEDQVLIHAQRPTATACAEMPTWNRIGRRVNKGATGIALFGHVNAQRPVRYVFDISDTTSYYGQSRPNLVWQLKEDARGFAAVALGTTDIAEDPTASFCAAIFQTVVAEVGDRTAAYMDELPAAAIGSGIGVMDEAAASAAFCELLRNSVGYAVLSRCGIPVKDIYKERDFSYISEFNTPEAASFIGNAINETSLTVLRRIEGVVKDMQRNFGVNLAQGENLGYDNARSKNSPVIGERSAGHENGQGVASIGRSGAEGGNGSGLPREVRAPETELSARPQERPLRNDADERRAEGALEGSESERDGAGGADRQEHGGDGRNERGAEGERSDALDGADEQLPALRGGDRPSGTDLQLNEEVPYDEQQDRIEEAAAETAAAFSLPQEDIDYVICRGSDVAFGKFRIYEQFLKKQSRSDNVIFLKKEYGIGGASLVIGGNRYSEDHDSKGITITRKSKESAEKFVLSWNRIEKRIRELISFERYLSSEEKERYAERQHEARPQSTANAESETPSNPNREYRFAVGSTVYIGTQEYEILSLDEREVQLYDAGFPLLSKTMSRSEFESALAFNPENDSLLAVVEESAKSPEDAGDSERPMEPQATEAPLDRSDEMLQQAMLAAELSEQTGQNAFAFEAGSMQPLNVTQDENEETEPVAPATAPRPHSKTTPFVLYPEIPTEHRHEHHIDNNQLGVGTPLDRFYHNIRAIQLLKVLEDDHRLASPTEQEFLADYVGWGGLPQFFEEDNAHYSELKDILTDEEYASARESSLTAFYTPPAVIRAVYSVLDNLGFQRGNILEPSCGVGNFLGMKPDKLEDSKIYGVELDSISGRIAQQLYQKSSIAVQGFEKTELPDSFFDAAIGNVPFGNFKVFDRRYNKHNFFIHDYFFAKTLDKVRSGGVIAFITSKGTLDKESPAVRKYIAERADLLGAIRLPNNTFKGAAGTDVTSDIIFLQKRDTMTAAVPEWAYLGKTDDGLVINQYFIDHPEMVLGEMREISGPYGPETACVARDGDDLNALLIEAARNIHGQYTEIVVDDPETGELQDAVPADPSVRNFSYTVYDGKLYYRQDSVMTLVSTNAKAEERIRGLIELRDCVRGVIELQTENYTDDVISSQQRELNRIYDDFVGKYGRINARGNVQAFGSDSSFFLLSSLERYDDDGNFIGKADIFSKRTIKQRVEITHVDTAEEALVLSLSEKAKVDMEYMIELTGKTEDQLFDELNGAIFRNPMYEDATSGAEKYLTSDEYLSGNVREKLRQAMMCADDSPDIFTANVRALEAVQPKDLTAAEISVRLGATWLPESDVEAFMFQLFDTNYWNQKGIHVHFCSRTGEWNIEGKTYDGINVKANKTYGTERINGYKIIEETLNLRDVRINDYFEDEYGRKKAVLNKKETAIAQGKQTLIKQAFRDWVWSDPDRRERLCRTYNEKFNSTRPREYDGSHLSFSGINPEIVLRKHQLNAIAHILYGGNTLLAHVVGAGKTFEMVAAAMESKRLGLCNKSLFVVPNHLTEQWASEFLQLYPAANILVATKKDFEPKNRKRFTAKIATGDYDAIIMGHSQLEKIPMSVEWQQDFLQRELDEIVDGIVELKESRGDRFSIKQLEKLKKDTEGKLEKLNDQANKDDVVTFEELGIDRLFVDEAHNFKNLAAFSKMRNVAGISQSDAKKSSDLYMKCRYLDELTDSHGVIFATGTPISNTMVELYTMQRYLQYETLKYNNLTNFDAWASTFGETVTAIELAPEGTGYRAKTRFAKFYNLPELMAMFKEVADIQTADMLNLPVPKAIYHNEVLKPSDLQKEMVSALSERAENVRSGGVDSSVDNMLLITNDGRKLALDQRLMNDMLPDSETSKVNACAQNVFAIWKDTSPNKSAQMIFCDLSTPHGDGKFNVYDDLKGKLINLGIPEEEIAFIHDAATEAKKKELFAKVRSGKIRVLIGSTFKMGAGTNAQAKLKALHHLDCPWRPADLQQREGRIVRQGNENAEVDIYTYVTEGTFDSYLYQLVEGKQKFIGQIMTSKSPVRAAEDVDEAALSYAEIKALCTGNPYIKEKMDLDIEVARLTLLKTAFLNEKYSLQDQIRRGLPHRIQSLKQAIADCQADIETVAKKTMPNEDGFSPMTIEGKTYADKKAAGSALLEVCHTVKLEEKSIGSYRGFDMTLIFDSFNNGYRLALHGNQAHRLWLGADIFGNIQRIDNLLAGFQEDLETHKENLAEAEKQLEIAKAEVDKLFPQEQELAQKTERLNELNALLDLDHKDNEIVDDGTAVDESERSTPDNDEIENAADELIAQYHEEESEELTP